MSQKIYPPSRRPHGSRSHYNNEDEILRTLYIKINNSRLPNDLSAITNERFRAHFGVFEEDIQKCNVVFHHDTGLPKGFGFATFHTRDAASQAMEDLQGTRLGGRHKLDISFKLPKQTGPTKPNPPLAPGARGSTLVTKPADNAIIEFKDEVVGRMMMEDNQSLVTVARRERVELSPLPPPCFAFKMKGDSNGIKVVKNYCNQLRVTIERNSVGYEQLVLGASSQPVCTTTEVSQYRNSLKKDLKVVAMCSFGGHAYQAGLRVTQDHVTFIRIVVGDLLTEHADAIVIPTGRAVDNEHSYPIELPSLAMCGNSRSLENSSEALVELGQTDSLDGGKLPCSYIIQALFPLSVQKSTDKESCDRVICNSLSRATEMNLGSVTFPGIKSQIIESIYNSLCSLGPTSLHTVNVVLETKFEAKRYETALRSLTSRNAGQEMEVAGEKSYAEAVNAPDIVPVGSSDFTWSWREDDGSLVPYSPAATDTLNKSYQEDRSGMCGLVINKVAYLVNFSEMKQINVSTHKIRDVIVSTVPTSGSNLVRSTPAAAGLQPHVVPWKYWDDFGRFTSYSPANSAKIEAMFQQRDESGHLVIQKRRYRFDFNLMKQINVYTGFSRDVRRVVSHQSTSSLVEQVVRFKPTFLSENEVVINLKGPLENLAAARKQLEQRIKALLFTKVIPLPTQVTPSLHQHFQEIARKHRISCTKGEGTAGEASSVLQLEGLESCVKGALVEVQELLLHFRATSEQLAISSVQGSQYPKEWDHMSETDSVKIIHLPMLAECQRVSQKFQETLPSAYVIKVQRVQNKVLWSRYLQSMSRLHEKNAGKVNEKHLFHGTRGEPAGKICKSEEGFDMRFSREGMWGQANYFAMKASYSDTYSHQDIASDTREMILAKVLTGDSYFSRSDPTLRMPPEKRQFSTGENQLQQVRYDSVNGETSGCVVYMTYSNDRAYPAYIITYSRTKPVGYTQPAAPTTAPPSSSYTPSVPSVAVSTSYSAQQPTQVARHPAASVNQPLSQAPPPPSQAPPPPPPPPLMEAAKALASSIVSRVAQKRDNAKEKCSIS